MKAIFKSERIDWSGQMKVIYYDCFSGISGDMNLGAMIDLGVDPDFLTEELKKLNIEDKYKLEIYKDSRKGIAGTKVDVIVHDHHHDHDRNLESIENLINTSTLNDNIKKISLKIFMKIAAAEAKVHGKDLYKVHFHEVGAVDSIIDIVGAAICFDYLNISRIMCSTVELGGGFVKCAHGLIPVPAPATMEILTGVPVKSGAVPFETTTPTGAAILAAVVDEFTDNKNFIIKKVAYGIGGRDTEIPNVLRVIIGETQEHKNVKVEEFSILETNIDDMNPELYEYVMDRAFEAGALDVFLIPIIMKKTRPAVMLSALCRAKDENSIKAVIFKETSTLGIRKYSVDRECLDRDFEKINTQYGEVTVKNSYFQGVQIKSKPEYEDCKRIALEKGIPVKTVYEEVLKNKN